MSHNLSFAIIAICTFFCLPVFAGSACPKFIYECQKKTGSDSFHQITPCPKGFEQRRIPQTDDNPADVEYGAVQVLCEKPCGPCSSVRWMPLSSTDEASGMGSPALPSNARGEVRIGMSMQEVRSLWGQPSDSSRVATESVDGVKTNEIWVFQKDAFTAPSTVTFVDGLVTKISRGSNPIQSKRTVHGIPLSSHSSEFRYAPGR